MIFDADLTDAKRSVDLAVAYINAIIWLELTNTWVPRSAAAPWGGRAWSAADVEPLRAQPQSSETTLYLLRSPNLQGNILLSNFFTTTMKLHPQRIASYGSPTQT